MSSTKLSFLAATTLILTLAASRAHADPTTNYCDPTPSPTNNPQDPICQYPPPQCSVGSRLGFGAPGAMGAVGLAAVAILFARRRSR